MHSPFLAFAGNGADRLACYTLPGYGAFALPLSSTQMPQRGEIKAMAADPVRQGCAVGFGEFKAARICRKS